MPTRRTLLISGASTIITALLSPRAKAASQNRGIADALLKRLEPCVQTLHAREMTLRVARLALEDTLPTGTRSYDIMKINLELLRWN